MDRFTYITDDATRQAIIRKRSKNLLKTTHKLSRLCDVKACSIVYGSDSPTPMVWPSVEEAQDMLTRFRDMAEYQQGAQRPNQEGLNNERIKKQKEELEKYQMRNYRNNVTRAMYKRMRGEETSKARLEDLLEMRSICDDKMKEIVERLEKINLEGQAVEKGMVNGMLAGSAYQGVSSSRG